MNDQWHYSDGEQTYGPVTAQELEQLIGDGTLSRDHYVMPPGEEEWTTVGESEMQWYLPAAAPPPLPAKNNLSGVSQETAMPASATASTKNKKLRLLLIPAALILLGVKGLFSGGEKKNSAEDWEALERALDYNPATDNAVRFTPPAPVQDYQKGFGNSGQGVSSPRSSPAPTSNERSISAAQQAEFSASMAEQQRLAEQQRASQQRVQQLSEQMRQGEDQRQARVAQEMQREFELQSQRSTPSTMPSTEFSRWQNAKTGEIRTQYGIAPPSSGQWLSPQSGTDSSQWYNPKTGEVRTQYGIAPPSSGQWTNPQESAGISQWRNVKTQEIRTQSDLAPPPTPSSEWTKVYE